MKDIRQSLINLFKEGFCTPQIGRIAKELKQPATTIHYNTKKMEKDGVIKTYKAVFDYKKIDQGHCTYVMINLPSDSYGNPEKVARLLAQDPRVESIDICTGEFELLAKLRTKDNDEYYEFIKSTLKKYGFGKCVSITSLKQIKSEFVVMD